MTLRGDAARLTFLSRLQVIFRYHFEGPLTVIKIKCDGSYLWKSSKIFVKLLLVKIDIDLLIHHSDASFFYICEYI